MFLFCKLHHKIWTFKIKLFRIDVLSSKKTCFSMFVNELDFVPKKKYRRFDDYSWQNLKFLFKQAWIFIRMLVLSSKKTCNITQDDETKLKVSTSFLLLELQFFFFFFLSNLAKTKALSQEIRSFSTNKRRIFDIWHLSHHIREEKVSGTCTL